MYPVFLITHGGEQVRLNFEAYVLRGIVHTWVVFKLENVHLVSNKAYICQTIPLRLTILCIKGEAGQVEIW